MYSKNEVLDYVNSEDVKFIRLAFCDLFGNQKNISILSGELSRAFEYGISIDGSAIDGFSTDGRTDLFLHPDPSTLAVLPWRPDRGRVVRMFCDITYPDGTPFAFDTRHILKEAIKYASENGVICDIGAEFEFYLFNTDENGKETLIPFDDAGYMDIAPSDRGENVRREICLTLENMDILPESSHHEEGPGQNEIDFKYSDALSAADNAVTFKSVVSTIATKNGLCASFMPKPVSDKSGNGMHINISLENKEYTEGFIAGVLDNILGITAFLNPVSESYERLGKMKAPLFVSWARERRGHLIRIPADFGDRKRFELRSPDPMANPYLAYSLLLYAGVDGIKRGLLLDESRTEGIMDESAGEKLGLKKLPKTLADAISLAKKSRIVNEFLPNGICDIWEKYSE